jgi:hypothetical protein
MCIEELYNLFPSSDAFTMMKSERLCGENVWNVQNRRKMYRTFYPEKRKERDHSEVLGTDGRMTIKWIVKIEQKHVNCD